MKENIFYCTKEDGVYSDFYKDIGSILFYTSNRDKLIYKVELKKSTKEETPIKYGWWNKKTREFQMICNTKREVEFIIEYGNNKEIDLDNGEICGLVVKELA